MDGSYVRHRLTRLSCLLSELEWDQACDIWSVGCVVFEIYAGHVLFQAPTVKEQVLNLIRLKCVLRTKITWKRSHSPCSHRLQQCFKFSVLCHRKCFPRSLPTTSTSRTANSTLAITITPALDTWIRWPRQNLSR